MHCLFYYFNVIIMDYFFITFFWGGLNNEKKTILSILNVFQSLCASLRLFSSVSRMANFAFFFPLVHAFISHLNF